MSEKVKKGTNTHAGRGGNNISLAPLTPDEALRHLLSVDPADVKKLEAEEKAAKGNPKKRPTGE